MRLVHMFLFWFCLILLVASVALPSFVCFVGGIASGALLFCLSLVEVNAIEQRVRQRGRL